MAIAVGEKKLGNNLVEKSHLLFWRKPITCFLESWAPLYVYPLLSLNMKKNKSSRI